jgi:Trk K+ transport system NAD-binding subunit
VVLLCGAQTYIKLLERNGRKGSSRAQRWAADRGQDKPSSARTWRDRAQKVWVWITQLSPLTQFLSLTLAAMLLLGIINFIVIGKNPADAIFLTLTVLNGGYGDITDFQESSTPIPVKLLAVLLALIGTALVGLVYGFVTDTLLVSRFHLGRTGSIPRSGHVIVAGLGHLGYRILQHLRQMDYEVVAIERDEDNPLIQAVRQEGIAVLVGDSTLPSILTQANVQTGRCFICTTRNDLANLETALTARSLNPDLRSVLRIFDPLLAERMQRYFQDLGASYSLASLAAPAFATAALVGSVFGTIQWEKQTLLVTMLTVAPRSPLLGLTLRALSHSYDLVVLVWQPEQQPQLIFPKIWSEQGDLTLCSGDRIYLLATVSSLSRLARSRPLPAETFRVKLLEYSNAYFEKDIAEAIAFYARQPVEAIKPLLAHLPALVSPGLPKEKAIKLARQLRKMSAIVRVMGELDRDGSDGAPPL